MPDDDDYAALTGTSLLNLTAAVKDVQSYVNSYTDAVALNTTWSSVYDNNNYINSSNMFVHSMVLGNTAQKLHS